MINWIDILLSAIINNNSPTAKEFHSRNLCIYRSNKLDRIDQFKYEKLIEYTNLLIDYVPAYYFILAKIVGLDRLTNIMLCLIDKCVASKEWYLLRDMPVSYLINHIYIKNQTIYKYIYQKNPLFFDDLYELHKNFLESNFSDKSYYKYYPIIPKLDTNKMFVTSYNYTSRLFYNSLSTSLEEINRSRTLNFFCGREIRSFSYKYYKFFQYFDGKNSWESILKRAQKENPFAKKQIDALFQFIKDYGYYFLFFELK